MSAAPETASPERGQWGSKIGFVLAASGSAIGLGNIVFFGANAYKYGGGAFYIPYFVALLAVGLPMMIVEFALGKLQGAAFPIAMRRVAGKKGEFIGWWSLMNALFIGMYYITILSWVATMMFASTAKMPGIEGDGFGPIYAEGMGPGKTFGGTITDWWPAIFALVIWALNLGFLSKGTKTIERVVKVFVPLMWLFMLVLVVRGLTLDHGGDGVMYLFTPNFDGIASPKVWQGAFAQMFFSLSLGLGTMTAYASYLDKKADVVANGGMVSFLNCGFEYIAGIAIFTIIFTFSQIPTESTLGMTMVVIPTGIEQFPGGQSIIALLFFLLLLIAGLTSSISILESPVSALVDKFGWSRRKALTVIASVAVPGSVLFALPIMLDKGGSPNSPVGLSLLDLVDHWAFGYSLLVVGLVEALFVGWVYGVERLRESINETARFKLGRWFDVLIKYFIPVALTAALLFNLLNELGVTAEPLGIPGDGLYKGDGPFDGLDWMPVACFLFWLVVTTGASLWLTSQRGTGASEEA